MCEGQQVAAAIAVQCVYAFERPPKRHFAAITLQALLDIHAERAACAWASRLHADEQIMYFYGYKCDKERIK